jgi:hypothetical protein
MLRSNLKSAKEFAMSQLTQAIKVLPWGEEVYLEIPLHKKSANKFYARHGKTSEGREYIEFSKFGPKPNTENETYVQKLRLFSPTQWAQIKHYVEGELGSSVGWDIKSAQKEFEETLGKATKKEG